MNNSLILFIESGSVIPVLFILGLLILALIFSFFTTEKRILRALKKTPQKPIHRIKENEYAKIIGKAKYVHKPLIAPISGRQCVYYHMLIQQKVKNGWTTYVEDKKIQDFFIESGNELAFINATQANMYTKLFLVKDHKSQSGFLNDPSVKLDNYLESLGKSSTNLLGLNKTLRFNEGIIELDEKIAIKGVAKWKNLKEPIEGYSSSKILHIYGSKEHRFLITDSPEATNTKRKS